MINTHFKDKKIIFFSAHPDDEAAGAGGLLLKAKKEGATIKLVLVIDPKEKRFDISEEAERETRLEEFKATAEAFGASHAYLGIPKYPLLSPEHIAPILKEIREFKPDILMMLGTDEHHTEHRQVNDLVMQAVWHAGRPAFPHLGEVHKTQTILECEADNPMREPNFLVDITEFMEEKKCIIGGYCSQVKRKDLVTAIEGLNAFRGHMYRKGAYAEAYKIKEFYYG
jgi:LmbE family N-acetylglucosaminyl deacetylase